MLRNEVLHALYRPNVNIYQHWGVLPPIVGGGGSLGPKCIYILVVLMKCFKMRYYMPYIGTI